MNETNPHYLISVVGPTASGKTELAIGLAEYFGTEVVSADSRQFFREMTAGTAKPTASELARVPHHFINSHSIAQTYNAGEFATDALSVIERLHLSHTAVVMAGGSGLYCKAVWEGFDEMPVVAEGVRDQLNEEARSGGMAGLLDELAAKDPDYFAIVDRNNVQRVVRALEVVRSSGRPYSAFRQAKEAVARPFRTIKIGLEPPRDVLYDRINGRMDRMIAAGLFEEAEALYPFRQHQALQTVGYQEVFGYLEGRYDREETIRLLKRNSRRYAKRQLTWFHRDTDIRWFGSPLPGPVIAFVRQCMEQGMG
ncbi:MAG: tRNA (adenosine(37)-N6)-dimethylallyltransferase MiaA [Cyclobacteriaceae bacterium]|nr:tRNA (adenosine(37)-N6)-dimethylallyltransferase MiaA [Cyclobacteriaceae bacterium]